MKLQDIQPILTSKEHSLLLRAESIHEDPNIHTNPDLQRSILRLMRMGLLSQVRGETTTYKITEKGRILADS